MKPKKPGDLDILTIQWVKNLNPYPCKSPRHVYKLCHWEVLFRDPPAYYDGFKSYEKDFLYVQQAIEDVTKSLTILVPRRLSNHFQIIQLLIEITKLHEAVKRWIASADSWLQRHTIKMKKI